MKKLRREYETYYRWMINTGLRPLAYGEWLKLWRTGATGLNGILN